MHRIASDARLSEQRSDVIAVPEGTGVRPEHVGMCGVRLAVVSRAPRRIGRGFWRLWGRREATDAARVMEGRGGAG